MYTTTLAQEFLLQIAQKRAELGAISKAEMRLIDRYQAGDRKVTVLKG
jgi:hypothetical protein